MVIKEISIANIKFFDKYLLSDADRIRGGELKNRFPDTPLITVEEDNTPVTGHDIIEYIRFSGADKFNAVVIENNPRNIFRAYLFKETFSDLTLPEKLTFLKKASYDFSLEEIRRECNPGFKISEELIKNLDFLTSDCVSNLMILNHLSLRNGLKLSKSFGHEDRITLANLLKSEKMSHSNQQSLLEISEELIFREKKPFDKIIRSLDYSSTDILTALSEFRYPALTKAREKWNLTIRDADLPENVKLIPCRNFESRKVTIEISAGDIEEALKLVEKIKND